MTLLKDYEGFMTPSEVREDSADTGETQPRPTTDAGFIQMAEAEPTPSLEKPTVDDDTAKDVVPPAAEPPVAEPPVEVLPEAAAPAAEPTAAVPAAIEPPVKVPEEVVLEEGVAPVVGLDVERDAEPDVILEESDKARVTRLIDEQIKSSTRAKTRRLRQTRLGYELTKAEKWSSFLDDTGKIIKLLEEQDIPDKDIPSVMERLAENKNALLGIFTAISTSDPLEEDLSPTDKMFFRIFAKAPNEVVKFYQDKKQVLAKILTMATPWAIETIMQFSFFLNAMGGEAAQNTLEYMESMILKDPKGTEEEIISANRANQELTKTPPSYFDKVSKYYTLYNKEGKVIKRGANATEKVMSFKKKWGIDQHIEDFREWLTEGLHVTEDERTMLDRGFGYAIEFQLPLFGLPTMGYIRHARLMLRRSEDILIRHDIRKYVKGLDRNASESSMLVSKLMEQAEKGKLGKHIRGDKQFFYLEGVPKGKQMKPHIYKISREKAIRAYDVRGRIGRLMGAGIFGASSEELLRAYAGDDYHRYRYIPYLFAMGGYMAGGRNTLRAISRVPFASAGFVEAAFGMGLVKSLAFSALPPGWVGRAGAGTIYVGGGWLLRMLRAFSDRGGTMNKVWKDSLDEWLNSDFGKFMLYQSGGGDLGKGWKAYREMSKRKKGLRNEWNKGEMKNYPNFENFVKQRDTEPNPLDALLDEISLRTKGTEGVLRKAGQKWTAMDAEKNLQAMKQFIRYNAELSFKGGVDFANEHLTLISQFMGSAQIQSLQRAVMGSHKFDQGIFQKEGMFASLKSLFSLDRASALHHLDEYHTLMDKQNQAIAHTVNILRQQIDVGPQTKRLLNFMGNEIEKNKDYIIHLVNLKTTVRQQFEDIEKHNASRELEATIEQSPENKGFTLEQFSPNVKSSTPLTHQQQLDIITDRGNEFVGVATHLLRNIKSTMYRESTDAYNKIDNKTPVNAAPIIRKLTEQAFSDSRAVNDLFGPPIPGVTKTATFIAYARQNFIREASSRVTPDYAKIIANEIWTKFQEEGWSLIFKRSTIEGDKNIENFFKRIIKKLEADPQSPSALQDLTLIRGMNDDAITYLDEFMPAILPLGKATRIRTTLWDDAERLTGIASDDARTLAKEVGKVFNASIEDSAGILGQLNFDIKIINETLSGIKSANKLYRMSIGEIWKTYHGQRMGMSSRAMGEMKDPPTIADRITTFLLDHGRKYEPEQFTQPTKDGKVIAELPEPYGIMMFRRMFPSDGKDIDIMAKNPDTLEMEKIGSIPRQEAREQMIKFFSHSIGLRLRNGDREWLENMPEEHLNLLRREGIINDGQVDTLMRYKKAINELTEGWEPTKIQVLHRNINDKVVRIIASENRKDKHSFLDEMFDGATFEISKFIKILFDTDFARSIQDITETADVIGRGAIEHMGEAKKLYWTLFRKRPPESSEELLEVLRNVVENRKYEIFKKPLEVLLEAVKDVPEYINGIEDLIYFHIAKESFKATGKKVTSDTLKLIGGKGNIDNNSKGNIVGKGGLLAQELDVVVMNDLVKRAIPMLERMIEFRKTHNLKGVEGREKALKSLKNIMRWSVMTKAEAPGTGRVGDFPARFMRRQIIGRIYNVARGFVHPGYVAAEYSFLQIGTRRAQLITSILTDARSMKFLEDMIINDKEPGLEGVRHMKKVIDKALRGMALTEDEKKQTSLDTPFTWTRGMYEEAYGALLNRPSPRKEAELKREAKKTKNLERLELLRSGQATHPTTDNILNSLGVKRAPQKPDLYLE